jgi:tRNA-specific 2-thiouridylase
MSSQTAREGLVASAKKRLVVAMSGGVDSSLAAALLAEEAAEAEVEVVGVTLHLAGGDSRCCSLSDVDDARRVAERLGIAFHVANYTELFRREVVEAFADEYLAGRTPIPCVACNKRFKFDYLMQRADVFGAESVATGHYARISWNRDSGLYELRRARDLQKDQSYFLFQLDQAQLARILFPLGEMSKAEVRERARSLGLKTADKAESQEICFVPDGDYARVVEELRPEARQMGGNIVDIEGRILGSHRGIHRYTVGQRHGLGISSDRRLYVVRIDPLRREVVVGGSDALGSRVGHLQSVHWVSGQPPAKTIVARVQVRHRHRGVLAEVIPLEGKRARVEFEEEVRAVAPGQAAVFYAPEASDDESNPVAEGKLGDSVLGGGWISR